jgi:hypothetical protein
MNNNRHPTFTRAHFDILADWIRTLPEQVTKVQAASALADVLDAQCRNFDRAKFLERALRG